MQIIIKFIIRSICEKKFRTFLILFSIVLSSALFFASNAISDTMLKMVTDRMKCYFGTADIIIQPKEKSATPYFGMNGALGIKDSTDYIVGIVQGTGTYVHQKRETVNFSLVGVNLDEYKQMNSVAVDLASGIYPFEGKKIIIGRNTAQKYGLNPGSTVDLEINGAKYKFNIAGIAQPTGLFINDGTSGFAVVPRETLSTLYGFKGKVNLISIKLKNPGHKQEVIKELSGVFNRYSVKEPISEDEINQLTGGYSVGFMMMTFMVAIISVFIIYTSFKVVIMEKLPAIGTFRSIGATRKMTNLIMLSESTLYGIIGGILGCILGIGILYVMAVTSGPDVISQVSAPGGSVGFKVNVRFTLQQLATAFVFAAVLSFISCIIPIIKTSKIAVKDIVLNTIEIQRRKKGWKLVVGIVFAAAAFAGPPLAPKGIALPIDAVCLVFAVVSVIMLIPYLTGAASKVFERIYVVIFGNIGILAAKNLRDNKSILNNISLLAIGISSLLMISTVGKSEELMTTKIYRSAAFDVWITSMPDADKSLVRSMLTVDGVSDAYPLYRTKGVEISGVDNKKIEIVDGIDSGKFTDFWKLNFYGDRGKLMKELDTGRNIILNNTMKHVLEVEKGDYLTLKLKNGNKTYKVIGFVNTPIGDGSYGLIPERYLKSDAGLQFYSDIFVKAENNPVLVKEALQKRYEKLKPSVKTTAEMEEYDRQALGNTFFILKGFSILTLVIGIFGVLNNLIISFIERKRSMAVSKSIGMSKAQVLKMIFIEALTGGIVGAAAGITAGLLLVWNVPYTMLAIDMLIDMVNPFGSLYLYLLAGVLIFVIASVSPAIKSSRLNIIQAIKYE